MSSSRSPQTQPNDDILNGSTVVTPAGTLVIDVYGPTRETEAADGATKPLRPHTHTTYDQDAPGAVNATTGLPYRLPTTTTVTAETVDGTLDEVMSRTFIGYDKVETSDAMSGWDLGQATTSTIDMDLSGAENTGDITTVTRYDAKGRVNIGNPAPPAPTQAPESPPTTPAAAPRSPGAAASRSMPAWSVRSGPPPNPPVKRSPPPPRRATPGTGHHRDRYLGHSDVDDHDHLHRPGPA